MTIEFTIEGTDREEVNLMKPFCEFLIFNLRQDIDELINTDLLQAKSRDLLKATWIEWTSKPTYLNMKWILEDIKSAIKYRERETGRYQIYFDTNAMFPYSKNKLEQIVRFIDKGNDVSKPTGIFSKIFNRYQRNIPDYREAYIQLKLRRFATTKAVVIV